MVFARVEYKKYGPLVFISHLDLIRCWDRITRRSGIPFSFTEGFHPRPRFSFAPPLPVGFEGERELLDIALESPYSSIKEAINKVVPYGIYVNNAYFIEHSDLGDSIIGGLYNFQWMGMVKEEDLGEGLKSSGIKDWIYSSEPLNQDLYGFSGTKNSLSIPILFVKGSPSPKRIVELIDGFGENIWLKLSRSLLLEK